MSKEPIEIVEPTEDERRRIFTDPAPLGSMAWFALLEKRVTALEEAVRNGAVMDGALSQSIGKLERNVTELNMQTQIIDGMRQRIERTQATLADLLQRFEAWKTIGNELGETVDAMNNQQAIHSSMLQAQGQIIQAMKQILDEIRAIITNTGDAEDALPSLSNVGKS